MKFSEVFNFNNIKIMQMFYLIGAFLFLITTLINIIFFKYQGILLLLSNIFNISFNLLLGMIFLGTYIYTRTQIKNMLTEEEANKIFEKVEKENKNVRLTKIKKKVL